ncbi:MAG: tetratricopeptide repeat protein [Nitrospiraceae bacterium]|nr:MAG: tetratricopeptide repeat protein [Nitrospiraceae bacterium]
MSKNYAIAIVSLAVLALFGYFFYQETTRENTPGENKYRMANQYLEKGDYEAGLKLFDEVAEAYPDYKEAHLGRAITLLHMEQYGEAERAFARAIDLDNNFAIAYANRGILYDKTNRFEEALRDYRKAIELNPEVAEGPGWLWRFLHNVQERPPTIADRADYIEEQLQKPEDERLLRVPELDEQQQMYKK